ncbi:hypothetical protein [Allocoleopsis sp.]|uniref:hypothetical protein n=1 Tax=Allocoleopsis sp. TaxID=3088169 RepID=UPI002FD38DAE
MTSNQERLHNLVLFARRSRRRLKNPFRRKKKSNALLYGTLGAGLLAAGLGAYGASGRRSGGSKSGGAGHYPKAPTPAEATAMRQRAREAGNRAGAAYGEQLRQRLQQIESSVARGGGHGYMSAADVRRALNDPNHVWRF